MEVFLCFVIGTLLLLLWILLAREFANIAQEKGYDDSKYFWWSLLGFPGWLMVIALPKRTPQEIDAAKRNKLMKDLRSKKL